MTSNTNEETGSTLSDDEYEMHRLYNWDMDTEHDTSQTQDTLPIVNTDQLPPKSVSTTERTATTSPVAAAATTSPVAAAATTSPEVAAPTTSPVAAAAATTSPVVAAAAKTSPVAAAAETAAATAPAATANAEETPYFCALMELQEVVGVIFDVVTRMRSNTELHRRMVPQHRKRYNDNIAPTTPATKTAGVSRTRSHLQRSDATVFQLVNGERKHDETGHGNPNITSPTPSTETTTMKRKKKSHLRRSDATVFQLVNGELGRTAESTHKLKRQDKGGASPAPPAKTSGTKRKKKSRPMRSYGTVSRLIHGKRMRTETGKHVVKHQDTGIASPTHTKETGGVESKESSLKRSYGTMSRFIRGNRRKAHTGGRPGIGV